MKGSVKALRKSSKIKFGYPLHTKHQLCLAGKTWSDSMLIVNQDVVWLNVIHN